MLCQHRQTAALMPTIQASSAQARRQAGRQPATPFPPLCSPQSHACGGALTHQLSAAHVLPCAPSTKCMV